MSEHEDLELSEAQLKLIKEFANNPEKLKYRYMVVYDMPDDWYWYETRTYSDAHEYIAEEMPKEARHAKIVNLIKYWEG